MRKRRNSTKVLIQDTIVDYLSRYGVTKRSDLSDAVNAKTGREIHPSNLSREISELKKIGIVTGGGKTGFYLLVPRGEEMWKAYLAGATMVTEQMDLGREKEHFSNYLDEQLSVPSAPPYRGVAEEKAVYKKNKLSAREILLGSSLSLERIHELTGVPLSMLSDWRDGVCPPFYVTRMLQELVFLAQEHPELFDKNPGGLA